MPRGQGRPKHHQLCTITSQLDKCWIRCESSNWTCFTKLCKEIFVESVYHASDRMAIYEKSYLISNLFFKFPKVDRCKLLYFMYCNMSFEGRCDMFSFLGSSLNEFDSQINRKHQEMLRFEYRGFEKDNKGRVISMALMSTP